ncbi:MAG: hypothetical protein RJA44_868 [Pseudomonadota bacterium]
MDPFSTPGAFSWAELQTADPDGAARFYGNLLGWSFEAVQFGPQAYRMARVGDEVVAGIAACSADEGVIPRGWGCYITVDDVDETAERCQMLGGKVLLAPTELGTVGRLAVLQDNQGAIFSAITYTRDPAA